MDLNPNYDQIYFGATAFYDTRWYGSAEEIERLAQMALQRTIKERGYEIYARIYWAAGMRDRKKYYFQDDAASWSDVVKGMTEVYSRYPSQWNANHFALFSCYKSDMDTARKFMMLIEEPIVGAAWQPAKNYKRCKLHLEYPAKQNGGLERSSSG